MSEGVAGTHLEVLFELGGTFAGLEGNAADQFPWAVLGRMEVRAFVVALDPCPHVIGQPDVGLPRVRKASEQINMVHGLAQRWLAIRSSQRDSSCGPTSPGVPPCYVGHTSLSAAMRAKYGRGDEI